MITTTFLGFFLLFERVKAFLSNPLHQTPVHSIKLILCLFLGRSFEARLFLGLLCQNLGLPSLLFGLKLVKVATRSHLNLS
jgi:hypothetical protein